MKSRPSVFISAITKPHSDAALESGAGSLASSSSAPVLREPVTGLGRRHVSPLGGAWSRLGWFMTAVFSFYHRHQVASSLIGLSTAGLLIHNAWLTSRPVTAGDWTWISDSEASSWFPWRSLWDASTGFGDKLFADSNLTPLLSLAGLLSRMGLGWGTIEKLLFFLPFAILSFVAPWVLARTILRSSGWAFVAVPIFALNTSLIIDGSGHLSLGMAEVMALLVLAAFIVALTRLSFAWSIISGLLLGVEAVYEIRIAYLTVLVAALYAVVLALAEPATTLRRLALSLLCLLAFGGTQAFWWLPLLTYGSDPGLPLASSPWIPFSRLANGITGVHPWWTGGSLAIFRTSPLNPAMFLLPIIAFVPLLVRRVKPEVVWLSLAALLAAFLLKQDNPPAGQVYDWFFAHFPGWGLFRDASKLYFIVALSYGVLVALAVRWIVQVRSHHPASFAVRILPTAMLAALLVISFLPIVPLAAGKIGFATQPTDLPPAFAALQRRLESDKNYGPVLWLGGAVMQDQNSQHYFRIASPTHPLLELPGTDQGGDPLASFCATPSLAYCYLNVGLFPYLLSRTGAAYVVAPASSDFGALPAGISWQWIDARVQSILGPPHRYGAGSALSVWELPKISSPIESAPAVAWVQGPPQLTSDVLPSLNALGLPVVYGGQKLAPSITSLSVVEVVPALDHSCRIESPGQVVVLAPTNKPSIDVLRDQKRLSLPYVLEPKRLSGWAVYGPVIVQSGDQLIPEADLMVPACLAWSPLTGGVLRGGLGASEVRHVSLQPELVTMSSVDERGKWLELRRAYDPGWTLSSSTGHLVGDGLFNLYPAIGASATAFRFSTGPSEEGGMYLASGWAILFAFIAWQLRKKQVVRIPSEREAPAGFLELGGRYASLLGMTFLGIACVFDLLAWPGLPSQVPGIFASIIMANGDPYRAYEYYVGLAFVALLIACGFRLMALLPLRQLRSR